MTENIGSVSNKQPNAIRQARNTNISKFIRRETPEVYAMLYDGEQVNRLVDFFTTIFPPQDANLTRFSEARVTLDKVGRLIARVHIVVDNVDHFYDIHPNTWVIVDPATGNVSSLDDTTFHKEYR